MKEIALILFNITDINVQLFDKNEKILLSTEESKLSDLFLRERAEILQKYKKEIEDLSSNRVLNLQNSNYQNYLIYSDGETVLMWGPFLTFPLDRILLNSVEKHYGKSGISVHDIIQYYRSLLIVSTRKISAVSRMIMSLTSGKIVKGDTLIDSALSRESRELPELLLHSAENQSETDLIVERYNNESLFMQAVSRGDKKSAFEILSNTGTHMSIADRVKNNPLRSILDFSITFNTLLRIAAGQGGVHPRQLHYLSEKFAILIETKKTFSETQHLRRKMIEEYCDAVRNTGTMNYSYLVKKAVRYIQTNLDEELSLNRLAVELDVNPSYLSRLFKKETGKTYSGYINMLRINNASYLLSYTNLSVSDIAAQAGYNDTAYFCRVFKNIKGVSPTGFRETNPVF